MERLVKDFLLVLLGLLLVNLITSNSQDRETLRTAVRCGVGDPGSCYDFIDLSFNR